jgi:hypothetical protein
MCRTYPSFVRAYGGAWPFCMPTPRTHVGLSCAAPAALKVESWRGEKRYEMQRQRLLEI